MDYQDYPAGPGISFNDLPDFCIKDWGNGIRVQRKIVSAANRFVVQGLEEPLIISSARHYSPGMRKMLDVLKYLGAEYRSAYGEDQGFIDQFDDYHTREQAFIIAKFANQTDLDRNGSHDELYSEGLY